MERSGRAATTQNRAVTELWQSSGEQAATNAVECAHAIAFAYTLRQTTPDTEHAMRAAALRPGPSLDASLMHGLG